MASIKKFIKAVSGNKGQNTVEFMLMMGTIVTLILTFFTLFHEKLAGMFFFLVGGILG
ncbi:hypothetical protein [Elusimicrobium minutum]|nr:hypothetical protein [Elusimicrobium minutum]